MVSGGGIFGIVVLVLVVVLIVGWVVYVRIDASNRGLGNPPLSAYIPFNSREGGPSYGLPRPAPGGVLGWFNDRIRLFKLRNSRSAAGAYEQTLNGGGGGAPRSGRRGFGPLDPDEAWDARVGQEADGWGPYEEQELGGTVGQGLGIVEEETRGRTRSRSPGPPSRNPFGDEAEPSNLGAAASLNPIDTTAGRGGRKSRAGGEDNSTSPTERKSVFREQM